MNGPPLNPEQRAACKRQLMEELSQIRQQKADVLRQIQQIAKKQRTSGPPPPALPGDAATKRQQIDVEHHRRNEAVWQLCVKIIQELLKNGTIKLYFGEPVRRDYAPNYYDVIKSPMDLGTIKREWAGRRCAGAGGRRRSWPAARRAERSGSAAGPPAQAAAARSRPWLRAGKLELPHRKYSDVYGFLSDCRLTFQNCRTFNPVGNHVRT